MFLCGLVLAGGEQCFLCDFGDRGEKSAGVREDANAALGVKRDDESG